jgi:hypothetical protein
MDHLLSKSNNPNKKSQKTIQADKLLARDPDTELAKKLEE